MAAIFAAFSLNLEAVAARSHLQQQHNLKIEQKKARVNGVFLYTMALILPSECDRARKFRQFNRTPVAFAQSVFDEHLSDRLNRTV